MNKENIRLEVIRMILKRDPWMPWGNVLTEAHRILMFIEFGSL